MIRPALAPAAALMALVMPLALWRSGQAALPLLPFGLALAVVTASLAGIGWFAVLSAAHRVRLRAVALRTS